MSDIHALSGAYAVDALDDLERARFERHLDQCPTCRDEVDSLREASALLADDAVATPPPGLRDQVLAAAHTVRPLPPVVPPVVEPAQEAPRRRRFPALVAAAAALIAIGGVGATVWHPWADDSSQGPSQGPQLSATDQVLQADDAEQVSQDLPDGGRATVWRSVGHNGAVIVTDLPAAPQGHFYEAWYNHDGVMVPAGRLADDGTVLLEGDAAAASGVAISIEPEGQPVEDPTTPYGGQFTFNA